MKPGVPKSVDEYIASQPEAIRPKLEQLRTTIKKAVPEAVECIGYRMPGYKLLGKPMLYFAAFKQHYSLFAASGTFFAALEDELGSYRHSKGTVHFPLTEPVPVKLVGRIAKLRAIGISTMMEKPSLAPSDGILVAAARTIGAAAGKIAAAVGVIGPQESETPKLVQRNTNRALRKKSPRTAASAKAPKTVGVRRGKRRGSGVTS